MFYCLSELDNPNWYFVNYLKKTLLLLLFFARDLVCVFTACFCLGFRHYNEQVSLGSCLCVGFEEAVCFCLGFRDYNEQVGLGSC